METTHEGLRATGPESGLDYQRGSRYVGFLSYMRVNPKIWHQNLIKTSTNMALIHEHFPWSLGAPKVKNRTIHYIARAVERCSGRFIPNKVLLTESHQDILPAKSIISSFYIMPRHYIIMYNA